MSLTLSYESTNYEPIEAGNHVARCIQVIDLGTHSEKSFESDEYKLNHKIRITWELPNEIIEWEDKETKEKKTRTQLISREFKASLHENAGLRKMLASWRGRDFTEEELKGFSLQKLLNVACMLNITHTEKDGKKYANITAVTPLAKGTTAPDLISELVFFDLDEWNQTKFDSLPEFLQEKIKVSTEYANTQNNQTVPNQELPDININDLNIQMPY